MTHDGAEMYSSLAMGADRRRDVLRETEAMTMLKAALRPVVRPIRGAPARRGPGAGGGGGGG